MLAFLISPLGRYVVLAIVALSAIGGEYAYLRVHYYNSGYTAAINGVAAKNKEATDAVAKAIKNVDDCAAHNGTWDATGGLCQQ